MYHHFEYDCRLVYFCNNTQIYNYCYSAGNFRHPGSWDKQNVTVFPSPWRIHYIRISTICNALFVRYFETTWDATPFLLPFFVTLGDNLHLFCNLLPKLRIPGVFIWRISSFCISFLLNKIYFYLGCVCSNYGSWHTEYVVNSATPNSWSICPKNTKLKYANDTFMSTCSLILFRLCLI